MAKPRMVENDPPSIAVAPDSTGRAYESGGTLSALTRYRDYRQLWLSSLFTQIGQWMLQVTLGWVMLEMTDSPAYVGLIGFASGLPFLIVSIPAGALIDRVDRRPVLLICQVTALSVSLGLALFMSFGSPGPWHLLAAAFLNGAALAINNTTRQTLIPSLVGKEYLQNAIALMSAGMNSTRILGPMLSGPLIALVGGAGALYIQSAFLTLALFNTSLLPSVRPVRTTGVVVRRVFVDGISIIKRNQILAGLLLLSLIPHLLVFSYLQFLPVFARDVLGVGADGLGWLYSAGGAGAVIGSLLVAGIRSMSRKGLFIIGGLLAYCAIIFAFSYSEWLIISMLLLFVNGVVGASTMTVNNTLFLMHIEEEARGRVMGIYLLSWGLMPLGALPMGFVGDQIGITHAVALSAIVTAILITLTGLRYREMRSL